MDIVCRVTKEAILTSFEFTKWFDQDFCFISCDPAVCPGVPRHETTMLWRAKADEVKICYSHEACGSVDYMTGYMESCKARGGSIVAGGCSCDFRHPPQSCTGNVELKRKKD